MADSMMMSRPQEWMGITMRPYKNWNALGSNYDIDLDNNKLSRH
jgi:hypothetical protein